MIAKALVLTSLLVASHSHAESRSSLLDGFLTIKGKREVKTAVSKKYGPEFINPAQIKACIASAQDTDRKLFEYGQEITKVRQGALPQNLKTSTENLYLSLGGLELSAFNKACQAKKFYAEDMLAAKKELEMLVADKKR